MTFPSSPTSGDKYKRWNYDGSRWNQFDAYNNMNWESISANASVYPSMNYIVGASIELTLPLSPAINDSIHLLNGNNTITLIRNSNNINGADQNLDLENEGLYLLTYIDATTGWQVSYAQKISAVSFVFQGSNYGYNAGGSTPTMIDKFSLTSDGNATDVGDLPTSSKTKKPSSQRSNTHGYVSGGGSTSIEKFLFASDGNASDTGGDLTNSNNGGAGQSSSTHGYSSGGHYNVAATNIIDKFLFSSDSNATDVGDLTVTRGLAAGQSSSTHGYTSGGATNGSTTGKQNIIDKFLFSSDGNATDVGDLSGIRSGMSGQSSTTHGYIANGHSLTNTIEKFSFSSDGNTTDVGDMTNSVWLTAGQSSTTHGYGTGGSSLTNVMQKFSFTSDGNATDVGDMTVSNQSHCGIQY